MIIELPLGNSARSVAEAFDVLGLETTLKSGPRDLLFSCDVVALSYWVIRSDVERVLGDKSLLNLLGGVSTELKGSSVDRTGVSAADGESPLPSPPTPKEIGCDDSSS